MASTTEDVPKPVLICKPCQFILLRANSNGLSALPDELLLEIASHIPPRPVTLSVPARTQIAQREVLCSLSEVCQNLRRVFRPYLWRRVEVYAGMRAGKQILSHGWSCATKPKKDFANELQRQLDMVTIHDPRLAQCVRIVDIEINEAYLRRVFTELGRCFSLFPNLHTVKIITVLSVHPNSSVIAAAKRGFKRSVLYPQIRSAILTAPVHPLLAVCPNLDSLVTSEGSPLLLKLIQGLAALQNLSCPLNFLNAEVVGNGGPSLQQITITFPRSMSATTLLYGKENLEKQLIKTTRLFTNLRTLILQCTTFPSDVLRESLEQSFLGLAPHDRRNLKEIIFSGYSMATHTIQEAIFTLPPL